MKSLLEKLQNLVIFLGVAGLILGVVNLFKAEYQKALYAFLLFGVLVVMIVISNVIEKINDKKAAAQYDHLNAAPAPVQTAQPQQAPLTVLGMVVLMQRPLRLEGDQTALTKSILAQQTGELKRVIAPTAKIEFIVAGNDLDDDAYIYAICRNTFESLGTWQDNDEFLSRVATGSFAASDGNRGKHFAFLNRKLL